MNKFSNESHPAPPLHHLSDTKKYHHLKIKIRLIGLALDCALLVLLIASGASLHFARLVESVSGVKAMQVLVYMIVFFNLFYLASLPLGFYSGYIVEKKFKLSAEPLPRWMGDEIKKYLLSLALFILIMEALFFIVGRFSGTWWILAGLGWLFLNLILTKILPTLIIPLFYPMKPIAPGLLKERLLGLCKKCGVRVLDIYEIALSRKTRKANAALVGIGKSRRVVLGDTLMGQFTPEEVEMVLAHELGHQVKRHIPKGFLFGFVLAITGFYLLFLLSGRIVSASGARDLTDLSLFPVWALITGIAGFLVMPLQNAFSRRMEYEADRFAVETMPSKELFDSVMRKLASQNLSDLEPNPWVEFWLYDHPSISNRIRRASRLLQKSSS